MNNGIVVISGLGVISIGYFFIATPLLFLMYVSVVSIVFMTIGNK